MKEEVKECSGNTLTPFELYTEISKEMDVSPGAVEYIAAIRSWCMTKRISFGQENLQSKIIIPKKVGNEYSTLRTKLLELGYLVVTETSDRLMCIKGFNSPKGYPDCFINLNDGESTVGMYIGGDVSSGDDISKVANEYGSVPDLSLTVVGMTRDGISTTEHYLDTAENRMPSDCFYPQIPCGVEELYNDFLKSDEPVLILIGAPGMGKTTLVRGLVYHANKSGCVVYDSDTVKNRLSDILSLMESERMHFAVFEDASDLISPREDGNTVMQTFLNTSDGLTPRTLNKKIIFTTNLPSISKIDEALLRPGRCYGVINFEKFNKEQASTVAEHLDIPEFNSAAKDTFTLAEIIAEGRHRKIGKPEVKRLGFR